MSDKRSVATDALEVVRPPCLTGSPPPPYEPIDISVLDQALARAMRRSRRMTVISMVPIIAVEAALYWFGANGVVLALAPIAMASIFAGAMTWLDKRTTTSPTQED